ncbi:hypothetical protein [Rhodococcus qingshengii]|uniref:hypothetical protein n=1 Tax=Rhodococcus qingshengii TaxID=334542 RepID=UPI0035D7FD8C
MSGLVFWQKPGENYVCIGELISANREVFQVGEVYEVGETTATVKRHGRRESFSTWLLREVVSRED